jgi:Arc/MetJ family transcription regulator
MKKTHLLIDDAVLAAAMMTGPYKTHCDAVVAGLAALVQQAARAKTKARARRWRNDPR